MREPAVFTDVLRRMTERWRTLEVVMVMEDSPDTTKREIAFAKRGYAVGILEAARQIEEICAFAELQEVPPGADAD